jgi:hypothetical protein
VVSARPDNLDVLPFADVADTDPDALPFGDDDAPPACPAGEETPPASNVWGHTQPLGGISRWWQS